jgi:hypothetical protein
LVAADAPDATASPAGKIAFLLDVFWKRKGRFDDLAIKVGDEETPVGTDRQKNGPKPPVG